MNEMSLIAIEAQFNLNALSFKMLISHVPVAGNYKISYFIFN